MEYFLPQLDEFVLDFDAEEAALLQAQMLAAGQMQAGIGVGPGLGAYPVRQVQNLPTAALRTRGRQQQQPQLAGGGAPAAAPVQLDSQLDALRREIARLEQQKQKQGTAKAAQTGTAAVGNGGVRRAQKGPNVTAAPTAAGTANAAGAAAHQGGPAAAQRQLAAKRARVAGPAPSQAGTAAASGTAALGAPRTVTTGVAGAAQALPEPTVSGTTAASVEQSSAAAGGTAVTAQKCVGSKRPADEGTGGPAAALRPQPKRQPAQQRSKQQQPGQPASAPKLSEARDPGLAARHAQPAGPRSADMPLQHPPQAEAAPLFSGEREGHHQADAANGPGTEPAASTRSAAPLHPAQKGPGASSVPPGFQQSLSDAGPGPPRKRPRAPGQRPAGSTSGPAAAAAAVAAAGGLPGIRAAAAAAGVPATQPVAPASIGEAGVPTASNSSASTQDGSPAAMLGQAKRARPEGRGPGPDASPGGAERDATVGVDEGAAGSGDEGLGASGARQPAGPAAHGGGEDEGGPATSDTDAAHISPEAEQAATAFLMSFMTQMSGQGQEGDRADATAVQRQQEQQQQQRRQNAAAATGPPPAATQMTGGAPQPQQHVQQDQEHQQHPQGDDPPGNHVASARAAGGPVPPGIGPGRRGGPGDGDTDGEGGHQVASPLQGMPAPGTGGYGGALARRAAAERTSAAVQRLRRKSSGVVGADPLLRPATSTGIIGAAAAAAATTSVEAVAGAAADGAVAGAGASATSPARADDMPIAAPLTAIGLRCQSERRGGAGAGGASAPPHPVQCNQLPAVHTQHPRPGAARGGVAANEGDATPAASAIGGSPAPARRTAGLGGAAASAARPHAPGASAMEATAADAEAQEPLGAVSSPVAAPPQPGGQDSYAGSQAAGGLFQAGPGGQARGLGGSSQPGAAAHLPPWVQVQAGGWGTAVDRARPGPGLPAGEAPQQLERLPLSPSPPLDRQGLEPSGPSLSAAAGQPYAAAMHAGAPSEVAAPGPASAAAAATAGAPQTGIPQPPPSSHAPHRTGPSAMPVRSGAPFGMLPPTGPPQVPFPHPQPWPLGLGLGLPPHPMLLAGHFPGAFPPGPPPPGVQWRPGQGPPGGVSLDAGQPGVSLVEVDVLARKELILLKWHMLQEMASELEADWVDACRAHNRLRRLSMAHGQPGARAAGPSPTAAGDPVGSADNTTPQGGVAGGAGDESPGPLLQPLAHERPSPHPHGLLLQQQQLQQQQQQQHLQQPSQLEQQFQLLQQAQFQTQARTQQQSQQQQQQPGWQQQEQLQEQQQQQQQHVLNTQAAASTPRAAPSQPQLAQPPAPLQQDQGGGPWPTAAQAASHAHPNGLQGAEEAPGAPGMGRQPDPSDGLEPPLQAGQRRGTDEEPRPCPDQSQPPPQQPALPRELEQPHLVPKRPAGDAPPGVAPRSEREAGPRPEAGPWQEEQHRCFDGALTVRHAPPSSLHSCDVAPVPQLQRQQQQQDAAASGAGAAAGEAMAGVRGRSADGAAGPPPPARQQPGSPPAGPRGDSLPAAAAARALTNAAEAAAAGAVEAEAPGVGGARPEPGAGVGADVPASTSAGVSRVNGDALSMSGPDLDRDAHAGDRQQQQPRAQPLPAARHVDADAGHEGGTAAPRGDGDRDEGEVAAASASRAVERPAWLHSPATLVPREVAQGGGGGEASAPAVAFHPSPSSGSGGDGGRGEGGGGGGRGGGEHGPGPSTPQEQQDRQQEARVWMPWEDAGARELALGAGAGAGEARRNGGAVAGQNGPATVSGDGGSGGAAGTGPASAGGEVDNGRDAGAGGAASFSGLRFKLAVAPGAGRRVAAMRVQPGALAAAQPVSPPKAVALNAGSKQPPVAALVAAPILRAGRRGSPAVAVGAAAPPAAAAAAPSAAAIAAVSAPAEPPLRVQSAPQVPPATPAHGGSPGYATAAAAGSQPRAQQASKAFGSSSTSGSAGLREVAAAVDRPAAQTTPHVQAPPAARGAEAASEEPSIPPPRRHGNQQAQDALPAQPAHNHNHQQQQQQQTHQQHHHHWQQQQQEPAAQGSVAAETALAAPSHLASQPPPSPAPPPLLYHARRGLMLTAQWAAAPSALEVLSSRYISPLCIFRSYSGSSSR